MVTKVGKGAHRAFGRARCANVTSKPNDAMAEVGTLGGGDERGHDALDLKRILFGLGISTEPSADADEVGICDDGGFSENIPQ